MTQEDGAGPANVITSPIPDDPKPDARNMSINDAHFMKTLERLKGLRSFLIQEAIDLSKGDLAYGGELNGLRFSPNGRAPTKLEWSQLERQTQELSGLLTDPLRQKLIRGAIPTWMWVLPIAFAAIAVFSLIVAISFGDRWLQLLLPCYLIWLVSL